MGDDEELRARREMYLAQKRGAAPKQAPLSQLQNNVWLVVNLNFNRSTTAPSSPPLDAE